MEKNLSGAYALDKIYTLQEFYGFLPNFISNKYIEAETDKFLDSYDPGKGIIIAKVPVSSAKDVDEAVESAQEAFTKWSQLPVYERLQYLLRLRELLAQRRDEFGRILAQSVGKTSREGSMEVFRAIQSCDAALGAPHLMAMTRKFMNIVRAMPEIDMEVVREPLGVFAIITPFNFPIMIPMWFIPWAVTLGNTVVVKPSEVDPVPTTVFIKLFKEAGYPEGVVNLIHGDASTVKHLIAHKDVVGVTFVGSTAVAEKLYGETAARGKRFLGQASAKNPIVLMPDAVTDQSIENIVGGFFDMAGQRCLAPGLLIMVGEAYDKFLNKILERTKRVRVGYQLLDNTDMGPVISAITKKRIIDMVERAISQGDKIYIDGREYKPPEEYKGGFYLGPTVLETTPDTEMAQKEIFGPVMPIVRASNFDEAIEIVNSREYGNTAVIFTSSGKYAREFARRAVVGNVGINISVAQPDQFLPFPGRKKSFFGVLHGQVDAIDFFTDRKVIIQRWW
jgi:malonate-semialdehyde dehydrogenase (acetylating)/methylmalonate-semialdehyde dehydrogenase